MSFKFILIPVLASLAASANAGLITIDNAQIYSRARQGAGSTDISVYLGTAPTTVTSLSAQEGDNQSDTQITWSGTDSSQSFAFDFSLERGAEFNSLAKSDAFDLTFTATADSTYQLSGAFNSDAGDGTVLYFARLLDVTTNSILFNNIQESRGTTLVPSNFLLGGTDGNWGSVTVAGSLSGLLLAGHQYQLRYDALIQSVPESTSTASAAGHFALDLASVPEPTSLMLLILGLGGLIENHRRKNKSSPVYVRDLQAGRN